MISNFCIFNFLTRNDWCNLEKAVDKVKRILRHVAVWIDPDWMYPAAASHDLKDFQWDVEMQDLLFRDKDFDRPFPPDADRLQLARNFIDELVRQVQTDGFWKDPKLNELVG